MQTLRDAAVVLRRLLLDEYGIFVHDAVRHEARCGKIFVHVGFLVI